MITKNWRKAEKKHWEINMVVRTLENLENLESTWNLEIPPGKPGKPGIHLKNQGIVPGN